MKPFDRRLEAGFEERQCERALPLLRVAACLGAVLFLLFLGWDTLVDPTRVGATLGLRLAGSAALIGLLSASYEPALARRPRFLLAAGAAVTSLVASAIVLVHRDLGHHGAAGFVLMLLVLPVIAPDTAGAVIASAVILVVTNVILAIGAVPVELLLEMDLVLLAGAGTVCTLAFVAERQERRAYRAECTLAEERRQLEVLAATDPLTGVHSRAHFLSLAQREMVRARRYDRQLSFLMLDLDHFKQINDCHGHAVGDDVLRLLPRTLIEVLRPSDVMGRMGGEEFAVVLPDTDLDGAQALAERLRRAVERLTYLRPGGLSVRCTLSIGCSEFSRDDPDLETAMDRADQALYRAKREGRNQVQTAAA